MPGSIIWDWLVEASTEYCQARNGLERTFPARWRLIEATKLVQKRLDNFAETPGDVKRALKAAEKAETWREGGDAFAKDLLRRVAVYKRKRHWN